MPSGFTVTLRDSLAMPERATGEYASPGSGLGGTHRCKLTALDAGRVRLQCKGWGKGRSVVEVIREGGDDGGGAGQGGLPWEKRSSGTLAPYARPQRARQGVPSSQQDVKKSLLGSPERGRQSDLIN